MIQYEMINYCLPGYTVFRKRCFYWLHRIDYALIA
nr:MAG TPA_asm: hypothetical protein [Caudoviricetes sp.]